MLSIESLLFFQQKCELRSGIVLEEKLKKTPKKFI